MLLKNTLAGFQLDAQNNQKKICQKLKILKILARFLQDFESGLRNYLLIINFVTSFLLAKLCLKKIF